MFFFRTTTYLEAQMSIIIEAQFNIINLQGFLPNHTLEDHSSFSLLAKNLKNEVLERDP